ncbi:gliding motility-associated C-terminal domain-containing protein [Porphyromonas circumdentaria]|uniref:Gliding motility-associated C-terminal domain-containing protein n=1 Tax=Porphyromonas circumdentaria TaxID=29524 RepID=A0A1T4LGW5_9PORP|nr:gliding motility-associated C-terminal domain-containing protein [Porphyromonas circumdentaria]MBB6275266.1 gliding motility-associated-like protein [Porphyromonas circumdentaria]MDO4722055.1 gliding motility-associated C-terminal domain-containing protein [Porphyromonas circumdentaria]SJZ53821.1 gliding motility-associated C-terminal domain-containing protein [Porphyromonas circumdentaria]
MKKWSKKLIFIALVALLCEGHSYAQVAFEGASFAKVELTSPLALKVYMVHPKGENFTLRIEGKQTDKIKTYKQQASEWEFVTNAVYNNGVWVIPNAPLDRGYIVEGGSLAESSFYWLVDYRRYPIPKEGLSVFHAPEAPCQQVQITASTPFQTFHCFSPEGELLPIARKFTVRFDDLFYDAAKQEFIPKETTLQVEPKNGELLFTSSLKTTDYKVVGDEYTTPLSIQQKEVATNVLVPNRLEVHPRYKLNGEEVQSFGKELSAPAEVQMEAIVNNPSTTLVSWRIISGNQVTEAAPIIMQYNGTGTTFRFEQAGGYTIILEASSQTGTCRVSAEPVTLYIQTSQLEVPNAFSPNSSPGINDVFRVVHKSIVKFEASIFNEWGNLLYRWNDPNGGWDGTYNGRWVEGGVYYYVIRAEGADGKKYDLKGHINILQTDLQEQITPL